MLCGGGGLGWLWKDLESFKIYVHFKDRVIRTMYSTFTLSHLADTLIQSDLQ